MQSSLNAQVFVLYNVFAKNEKDAQFFGKGHPCDAGKMFWTLNCVRQRVPEKWKEPQFFWTGGCKDPELLCKRLERKSPEHPFLKEWGEGGGGDFQKHGSCQIFVEFHKSCRLFFFSSYVHLEASILFTKLSCSFNFLQGQEIISLSFTTNKVKMYQVCKGKQKLYFH